jgi:hypothetical protein
MRIQPVSLLHGVAPEAQEVMEETEERELQTLVGLAVRAQPVVEVVLLLVEVLQEILF